MLIAVVECIASSGRLLEQGVEECSSSYLVVPSRGVTFVTAVVLVISSALCARVGLNSLVDDVTVACGCGENHLPTAERVDDVFPRH